MRISAPTTSSPGSNRFWTAVFPSTTTFAAESISDCVKKLPWAIGQLRMSVNPGVVPRTMVLQFLFS